MEPSCKDHEYITKTSMTSVTVTVTDGIFLLTIFFMNFFYPKIVHEQCVILSKFENNPPMTKKVM